ncbi:filamentous hemagglutinin, partial [bacterium]
MSPIARCVRQVCLPAASLFLTLNPGAVFAGPEGGQVAAGKGNISTPNSTTTVINQKSQNLVVDWKSFNVKANELVRFKQPSAKASALNRIHDQNPSKIFGSINANGNVLLVNPNGVFFSPTASVNVNSLIASGLDIKTKDFMAGRLDFNGVDGTGGMVVNQGILQAATGGSISLVGKAVINEGVILATAGQVNLVAGKQVTIDFDGDGLMQFAVDREVL